MADLHHPCYEGRVSLLYKFEGEIREVPVDLVFTAKSDIQACLDFCRWIKCLFVRCGQSNEYLRVGCIKIHQAMLTPINENGEGGITHSAFRVMEWKCDTGLYVPILTGRHPLDCALEEIKGLSEKDWIDWEKIHSENKRIAGEKQ